MKLPFFKTQPSTREHIFGLFLKENRGIAYIFEKNNHKLILIAKQEFEFSNGWENITNDVDEVLFKLESETKTHVEKVIIFLFSHLIDEKTKEIKKPYLQKIKELTRGLEIRPIGYIECYEGVVNFLQNRDGSPLTSILIELDTSSVDVFIYKGGHKVHTNIISRTDDIISDLHAAFDSLGQTLLPNRIILYNSSNLIEESTKIITHKWSSDLFVQIPRVDILKEADILKGLILLFEQQLKDEENPDRKAQIEIPGGSSDLITDKHAHPSHKTEQKEVLGFVIGRDVVESGIALPEKEIKRENGIPDAFSQKKPSNVSVLNFQRIQEAVGSGIEKIKSVPFSRIIPLLIPVVIIAGILGAAEFFIHRVSIYAVLPSKTIDKNIERKAAISEEREGYITIQVATSSVELTDVRSTTGKRDVGEKARGEVTVYNFDEKDRTFPKNTVIEADNVQFTTDDEVKVAASALTSDASAKLPGKSKVKVTAKEIGPESNLDKGKRFKIGDLSVATYFAMNDSAFSGGTRKTVRTVSKKDVEDLESSLMNKAKNEQKKKLTPENRQITMIDSLTEYELSGSKFSKEVGEEGDTVSLKATVLATYYYFDNGYLNTALRKELEKDIGPGYELRAENISYNITEVRKEKTEISLELKVKAKATKSFHKNEMIESIRGKSVPDAKKILEDTYDVKNAVINVAPRIPPFNSFMPVIKKNIELQVDWE